MKAVQLKLKVLVLKSTEEKVLGLKFDFNLSFESRITSLCKKASQKLLLQEYHFTWT